MVLIVHAHSLLMVRFLKALRALMARRPLDLVRATVHSIPLLHILLPPLPPLHLHTLLNQILPGQDLFNCPSFVSKSHAKTTSPSYFPRYLWRSTLHHSIKTAHCSAHSKSFCLSVSQCLLFR